jgi:hypothetical protein
MQADGFFSPVCPDKDVNAGAMNPLQMLFMRLNGLLLFCLFGWIWAHWPVVRQLYGN